MKRAIVSFSDSVSGRSAGFRVPVAGIVRRVPLVVDGQRGRRDVEAAPPDLGLRLAVFRGGFRLVQSLQRAIAALVQPPAFRHRNPQLIERVQRNPQRLDRALQHGREGDVEHVAAFLQQTSSFARFLAAPIREIYVVPTGEPVLLVPGTLAVT